MDTKTKVQRSDNMARIKGNNTTIEIAVRKELFRRGYRFRKNDKRLPGCPDIVMPKYNTVIFVHGCFWHRHPDCKLATIPKSNMDYWQKKFQRNIERDNATKMALAVLGWKVIEIWECDIKRNLLIVVDEIERELTYIDRE